MSEEEKKTEDPATPAKKDAATPEPASEVAAEPAAVPAAEPTAVPVASEVKPAVSPAPASDGRGGGDRGGRGGGRGGGGRGGGSGGRGGGGGGGGGGGSGGGSGRGGGGGRGGRGRGRGGRGRGRDDDDGPRYEEKVVKINRVAATVKGGRRMSFSALVVLGDKKGTVGVGFGKAKEVQGALEKAFKDARSKMHKIPLKGTTICHEVLGAAGTARMKMVPASPGTGVIAGASARAVLECVGVQDVLTKQYGSNNPLNVVKATLEGLLRMRTKEQVEKLRGVTLA